MDPRLQRRVQRYGWDRAADHYERGWRSQLEPAQRRLLEFADLQPGERVLDVATGTGLVAFAAAEAVGPGGAVLATDLSDRMIELAQAEAVRRGLTQIRFRRMGAEQLDLPDDESDSVLCALGLMYAPDPGAALAEMWRVLRPGGRAAVAVWGARTACGWAGIFPVVDERMNTEVCPLFFQLGTGSTLEQRLEEAGFEDVGVDRLTVTLRYDTEDDALTAAFAGGPVAMAYARFDDATRADAHAAYLETIAPFKSAGGYDIPGEFVVAGARRPA